MPAKKCASGKRPSKSDNAKCVKKRKVNPALKKWAAAAKAEGYMKKGAGFKPLPKKGSAGYKAIKARVAKM